MGTHDKGAVRSRVRSQQAGANSQSELQGSKAANGLAAARSYVYEITPTANSRWRALCLSPAVNCNTNEADPGQRGQGPMRLVQTELVFNLAIVPAVCIYQLTMLV